MKINERKAVTDDLMKYCYFAKEGDYIEVTEWTNEVGYDININEKKRIALTIGELEAIQFLVKALDYNDKK